MKEDLLQALLNAVLSWLATWPLRSKQHRLIPIFSTGSVVLLVLWLSALFTPLPYPERLEAGLRYFSFAFIYAVVSYRSYKKKKATQEISP